MNIQEYLVPREGVIVRDPRTKAPLPTVGMFKDMIGAEGRYWRRKINQGDVTIGKPPEQAEVELRTRKSK